MASFLFLSAAAARTVDRSPHRPCGHELNMSLVDGLSDKHMDEVLGSDGEAVSCAIEVRDMAPGITEEYLELFFKNRKRSGGDQIEEMFYQDEERRAVITFTCPEGCTATWLWYIIAVECLWVPHLVIPLSPGQVVQCSVVA